MDNTFPLVALALVLAMIASLAVEIVRKATPECPAGTVTSPSRRVGGYVKARDRNIGTQPLRHAPAY